MKIHNRNELIKDILDLSYVNITDELVVYADGTWTITCRDNNNFYERLIHGVYTIPIRDFYTSPAGKAKLNNKEKETFGTEYNKMLYEEIKTKMINIKNKMNKNIL